MRTTYPTRRPLAFLLALAVVAASCGDDDDDSSEGDDSAPATDAPAATDAAPDATDAAPDATDAAPATDAAAATDAPADAAPVLEGELAGLFGIEAGECATAGSESGSFFRMVAIGGTAEDGPFVPNGDSPCADQTFIPLLPGTDGGLLSGTLQPADDPPFDADGNATASRIAVPVPFFGVDFGMATTDEAPPPMIIATEGELSGDVAAMSAYYAGEIFNQGSPKPDGSAPGVTTPAPTGTIDVETGSYSLDWASEIVGGAFNEFTGVWRLEGIFDPRA